jgi:hypothetical protein
MREEVLVELLVRIPSFVKHPLANEGDVQLIVLT